MYYILNQTGQIVAVDPRLLSQLQIDSVDDLYKKIVLDEITVNFENRKVILADRVGSHHFSGSETPLNGLLGDLTLVIVDEDSHQVPIVDIDYEALCDLSNKTEETSSAENLLSSDNAVSLELKEATDLALNETATKTVSQTESELFDLILPSDAENTISEIEDKKPVEEVPEEEKTPIYIDIDTISQKIGISTEDYKLFFDEYIDTALMLEEALQSSNQTEQQEALHKLSHLSSVLRLPYTNDLLKQIENASDDTYATHIQAFFATLGRLTTLRFDKERAADETGTAISKAEDTVTSKSSSKTISSRAPINLSDVKPIHFDFQLEEAAKDLGLPIDLIEEFVDDFIIQAHEETKEMLGAYEKGDLGTIQKIGHLLKGISGNLRINPLSDTLYEIQFNEDIEKIPELVRNYWGYFLSLENQFKLISKQ